MAPQELTRQNLQAKLDGLKTQADRNFMGQFATPYQLAKAILHHAKLMLPAAEPVRFIDPAFGTGSFYSALHSVFPANQTRAAAGYEIDAHYAQPTQGLWADTPLKLHHADFTQAKPPKAAKDKYNLLICNPPYVRHHHLKEIKQRLQADAYQTTGIKLSGLAGLYCYFMLLAHNWLAPNGVSIWLIPSEFMDVNYGRAIKDYLLSQVTLEQIHRFNPAEVQFDDALVSTAIVCFRNVPPPAGHQVLFTYGGTLEQPEQQKQVPTTILATETKWTRFPISSERLATDAPRLRDFFQVKRGIATGDNKYFVLSRAEIEAKQLPLSQFRPILPSPRYLDTVEVGTDRNGYPSLKNPLFVLDCKLSLETVSQQYPALYAYLQEGIAAGVSKKFLCQHRKVWYAQENRPSSSFYCTYIGRTDNAEKQPFRFILNHSQAIVSNSYLILYPKQALQDAINNCPDAAQRVLETLNSIAGEAMVAEGRVYGGGMHKLEPKELANVPVPDLISIAATNPATSMLDRIAA